MPYFVHSHPPSSLMCNIDPRKPGLQVPFLHIPPNIKSSLARILPYLVQSASAHSISSQTHKRVYLQECKHFKQLYAISSVPPEVKKTQTRQYWRKTTSGNKVKHNVNLSHWINKKANYLFIFQYSNFGFISPSIADIPCYNCFTQPWQFFVIIPMVLLINLSF